MRRKVSAERLFTFVFNTDASVLLLTILFACIGKRHTLLLRHSETMAVTGIPLVRGARLALQKPSDCVRRAPYRLALSVETGRSMDLWSTTTIGRRGLAVLYVDHPGVDGVDHQRCSFSSSSR